MEAAVPYFEVTIQHLRLGMLNETILRMFMKMIDKGLPSILIGCVEVFRLWYVCYTMK